MLFMMKEILVQAKNSVFLIFFLFRDEKILADNSSINLKHVFHNADIFWWQALQQLRWLIKYKTIFVILDIEFTSLEDATINRSSYKVYFRTRSQNLQFW